jgi:hypothetical protein
MGFLRLPTWEGAVEHLLHGPEIWRPVNFLPIKILHHLEVNQVNMPSSSEVELGHPKGNTLLRTSAPQLPLRWRVQLLYYISLYMMYIVQGCTRYSVSFCFNQGASG